MLRVIQGKFHAKCEAKNELNTPNSLGSQDQCDKRSSTDLFDYSAFEILTDDQWCNPAVDDVNHCHVTKQGSGDPNDHSNHDYEPPAKKGRQDQQASIRRGSQSSHSQAFGFFAKAPCYELGAHDWVFSPPKKP